jgi:glycosyltransferase involved in cell wall biosynthesis
MPRQAPYHIGFVIPSFGRGGLEMRLADIVRELDKSRWNPHIYSIHTRNELADKVEPERLHIPFSAGKYDVRTPIKLAMAFRQNEATIVWAMTQGITAGWGRLAAILARAPIRVLSIHDNSPLAPLTRLLNPWTDAIVVNSQFVANRINVPARKLVVHYNGLDTQQYAPGEDRRAELFSSAPDRPVILNVGRLNPEKGRDIMLKAAVPLMKRHNPPLIVFAGDGPQRGELTQLADELGIRQQVRFLGSRDDVPDLLRSCDVVVMSSRDAPFGESCPNIVIEGMASAKPVVGSDVGGTSELIREGETGFLVPADDPGALAEKLSLLLDDSDLRKRFGAAGRKVVEGRFTMAHMVKDREMLFERLLNQKGLS